MEDRFILEGIAKQTNEVVCVSIKVFPWNVIKKNDKRLLRTNITITSNRLIIADLGFWFKCCGENNIIDLELIDKIEFYIGHKSRISRPLVNIYTSAGDVYSVSFSNRNSHKKDIELIVSTFRRIISDVKVVEI